MPASLRVSEQSLLRYKKQESWLGIDKGGKNTRNKGGRGVERRGEEEGEDWRAEQEKGEPF